MVTWLLFFWDGIGGASQIGSQPVIAARLSARSNAASLLPRSNATTLPARANVAQLDRQEA